MSYEKGLHMINGFSIDTGKPADLKYIADSLTVRDSYISKGIAYDGMLVYVKETKKVYQLLDNKWKEFGFNQEEFQANIYDGLNSDSSTLALSARQGKILNTNLTTHMSSNIHITVEERNIWNAKASTALVTQTTNGLMSSNDKKKLDNIESGANKYIHPETHNASIIVEDTTHRFVTDEEISYWNAKASTDIATTTSNGLMSSNDKVKLDGIESGANNITVDASLSSSSTNPLQNKVIHSELAKKSNTDHTHFYAGSSSVGGSATSAEKLSTARSITVGSTTKTFDGTANIAFNHKEIKTTKIEDPISFGNSNSAITTEQFIQQLTILGAFDQVHWIGKGTWDYVHNSYITDTGFGNLHLAGCIVEVFYYGSYYTIRITAPTTSASGGHNGDYIYINNGSEYKPGWRKLYSTAYKPTLSDLGLSSTTTELNQMSGITGNVQDQINTLTNNLSSLQKKYEELLAKLKTAVFYE